MKCPHCLSIVQESAKFCSECGKPLTPAARSIRQLDFSEYINDRTQDFTGREWAFTAITSWLTDPSKPRTFLVGGGPGSGKTALSARLAQFSQGGITAPTPQLGQNCLTYAHFCQAGNDASLNPLDFVGNLSLALSRRDAFARALLAIDTPGIHVESHVKAGNVAKGSSIQGVVIQNLTIENLSAKIAFDQVIRKPLEQVCGPGFDEIILILVDALDEAQTLDPEENIAALLAHVSDPENSLPSPVRFLLTGRFHDQRLRTLFRTPDLDLIDHAPPDKDDVHRYASYRLGELAQSQKEFLAAKVANASQGNFLYARYILDELLEKSDFPDDLSSIEFPDELEDIYKRFIQRELTVNNEKWEDRYSPILGLLAVAHSPGLSRQQIINISGLNESRASSAIKACSQYLAGSLPEGPFTIYHQSFRDYLIENQDYQIFPREAHRILGEFFVKTYSGDLAWLDCQDDYALRYSETHLQEAIQMTTLLVQKLRRQQLEAELAALQADRGYRLARALRFKRSWVFQRVDQWLSDDDGAQVFLITGPPGSGKTYLAKRLVEVSKGNLPALSQDYASLKPGFIIYAHFCQAIDDSTLDPRFFIRSISQSLNETFATFKPRLEQTSGLEDMKFDVGMKIGSISPDAKVTGIRIENLNLSDIPLGDLYNLVFRVPIEKMRPQDLPERVVILVDGLDEALGSGDTEDLASLLAKAVHIWNLPAKLRLLILSRKDPRIFQLFDAPSFDLIEDVPTGTSSVDDLAAYAYSRLEALENLKQTKQERFELAYRVAEASDGIYLFASLAIDEISRSTHPGQIEAVFEHVKSDLEGFYHRILDQITGHDFEQWITKFRPILGALAVARGNGLTFGQLSGVSHLDPTETRDVIRACTQLLAGPGPKGTYRFFHEAFGDYLLSPDLAEKYFINSIEANLSIAFYALDRYRHAWDQCEDDYALMYTPAHLLAAALGEKESSSEETQKIIDELIDLDTNLGFLQKRIQRLGLKAVLADVRTLMNRLPDLDVSARKRLNNAIAQIISSGMGSNVEVENVIFDDE